MSPCPSLLSLKANHRDHIHCGVEIGEFGRAGCECVIDGVEFGGAACDVVVEEGAFGGSGCDGVVEGSGNISEAVVNLMRFVRDLS